MESMSLWLRAVRKDSATGSYLSNIASGQRNRAFRISYRHIFSALAMELGGDLWPVGRGIGPVLKILWSDREEWSGRNLQLTTVLFFMLFVFLIVQPLFCGAAVGNPALLLFSWVNQVLSFFSNSSKSEIFQQRARRNARPSICH